jgi:hypothetical protein
MRPVQRRRMEDRLYADHAATNERRVGYRAHASGERARAVVETDDVVPVIAQCANQRLAEMTRASCDECPHAVARSNPCQR